MRKSKHVPVQENGEPIADPNKEKLPVDVEGKVEQGQEIESHCLTLDEQLNS